VKHCLMCATDKEDVSMVQVAPATWNGFNDFAEVCAECQTTRRFKMWAKSKKPKPTVLAGTDPNEAVNGKPAQPSAVRITHRRTGALLHLVDSPTLAQAALSNASLSGADLQHAAMRGADLHRADLHLADLAGADLRGADMRGVNLRGADLRGTDLRDARLYRADLSHVLYDAETRWPAGFEPGVPEVRKPVG
jgi:hypothetical protein